MQTILTFYFLLFFDHLCRLKCRKVLSVICYTLNKDVKISAVTAKSTLKMCFDKWFYLLSGFLFVSFVVGFFFLRYGPSFLLTMVILHHAWILMAVRISRLALSLAAIFSSRSLNRKEDLLLENITALHYRITLLIYFWQQKKVLYRHKWCTHLASHRY